MAGLFHRAAQKAMQMSERKPDPVTIDAGPFKIKIPMGGGGLSSLQKNISIKGQPHELSYITPGEGGLLKQLGGSGRMVNGVPAYDFPDYDPGVHEGFETYDPGDDEPGDPRDRELAAMMLSDPFLDIQRKVSLLKDDEDEENKNTYENIRDGLISIFSPEDKATTDAKESLAALAKNYEAMAVDTAKAGVTDIEAGRLKQGEGLLNLVQESIDREDLSRQYNIPLAQQLERLGLKTFGKGMRGAYEVETGKAVSREAYDPDKYNLMDIASPKGAARLEFEQIAKENPNLTASELLSKFNANDPSLKRYSKTTLSPGDLSHLGLTADAPMGQQVNDLDSARYRGALQGIGMIMKGIGAGPIAVGADLFNEGKGIGSLLADIFEKESGYKIPGRELYGKIEGIPPTEQEMIDKLGRRLGPQILPNYRETGGKVTPLPPIINPPTPIPIPPDPEPEPEDTRTPMEKYYNIDPEKDEWYKDEDRKVMEEYYKDFPSDRNPNYTANQLRILAFAYPELFGNLEE
tara:strand:- start:159 stop:1718 length:1560 start_codon:yes stop_codon:yes gene_type:complete